MTRQQVLDFYFIEARSKLIDVAAFLDRVQRAEGKVDFRLSAYQSALKELHSKSPDRTRRVLKNLSDPTVRPVEAADGKAACGAWDARWAGVKPASRSVRKKV